MLFLFMQFMQLCRNILIVISERINHPKQNDAESISNWVNWKETNHNRQMSEEGKGDIPLYRLPVITFRVLLVLWVRRLGIDWFNKTYISSNETIYKGPASLDSSITTLTGLRLRHRTFWARRWSFQFQSVTRFDVKRYQRWCSCRSGTQDKRNTDMGGDIL